MLQRKHPAFTLIELLIVIVIIAILATVSIVTYSGYIERARDTLRFQTVSEMANILRHHDLEGSNSQKYLNLADNDFALFNDLLASHDFKFPTFRATEGNGGDPDEDSQYFCYFLIFTAGDDANTGNDNQFAVLTWGEQTSTADPSSEGMIIHGSGSLTNDVLALVSPDTNALIDEHLSCSYNSNFDQNLTASGIATEVNGDVLVHIGADGIPNTIY